MAVPTQATHALVKVNTATIIVKNAHFKNLISDDSSISIAM